MSQKSRFADDIRRFAKRALREQEIILRRVAIEVNKEIVMKTPVDTGRARANWVVEINRLPDNYEIKSTSPSGAGPIAEARNVVQRAKAGDTIYIVNGLPYIRVIEYGEYPNPPKRGSRVGKGKRAKYVIKSQGGYSKQAPQGMIRITAQRWASFVKEVANGDR